MVLTPRRWRQVLRRQGRPERVSTSPYPLDDGGKRARSPGRARRKPLKPLRVGTPGDAGGPVVTTLVCCFTFAREAAGAAGTRRSPRPRFRGEGLTHNLGAARREIADAHLTRGRGVGVAAFAGATRYVTRRCLSRRRHAARSVPCLAFGARCNHGCCRDDPFLCHLT